MKAVDRQLSQIVQYNAFSFLNNLTLLNFRDELRCILVILLEPALQGVGRRGVGDGNLIHKKWLNTHTNTLKPPELIIKISLWSGFRGKKSLSVTPGPELSRQPQVEHAREKNTLKYFNTILKR